MKKAVFAAVSLLSVLPAIAADVVPCDDDRAKYCFVGEQKFSEGFVLQIPGAGYQRCVQANVSLWGSSKSGQATCPPLVWVPVSIEDVKLKR